MAKFILRVDDCGWTPEKNQDHGLGYFLKWRDAAGLRGLPVSYGFIPTMLSSHDAAILAEQLTGDEALSVHGWDHARDGDVTAEQMSQAIVDFTDHDDDRIIRSYIPPFNRYGVAEMERWAVASRLERPLFFGGFIDDEQSLNFGPQPEFEHGVIHIPAYKPLYDRAGPIAERLPLALAKGIGDEYPVVVTLHCTWDANDLAAVGRLVDLLKPYLATEREVIEWTQHRNKS